MSRPENVIAEFPPEDQCEWDWEPQCARCGSSVSVETCERCCGDGVLEDETDCCDDICQGQGWCMHGDDEPPPCPDCNGHPVWRVCLSSPDFCETHPLPGREATKRGEIEWFVTGRAYDGEPASTGEPTS